MSDRRTTYAEQKTTRAARANAARMPSVPKERSRRNGDYSPPPRTDPYVQHSRIRLLP